MDTGPAEAKPDLVRIAKNLARTALQREKDSQARKKARRRELAHLEKKIGKTAVMALRSCGVPIDAAAAHKVREAVENHLGRIPGGDKNAH